MQHSIAGSCTSDARSAANWGPVNDSAAPSFAKNIASRSPKVWPSAKSLVANAP